MINNYNNNFNIVLCSFFLKFFYRLPSNHVLLPALIKKKPHYCKTNVGTKGNHYSHVRRSEFKKHFKYYKKYLTLKLLKKYSILKKYKN